MRTPRRTSRRDTGHPPDRVAIAPADRRKAILRVIRGARKHLILSVFRCDVLEVLDALADALKRNVKVEILITGRAKGWQERLERLWVLLGDMGATLHRYADPVVKYHAKYIVADKGPALVASLNLTRKCFTSTVDFVVTTHDPGVVSGLTKLFRLDCGPPAAPLPRGLSERLIIGPEAARRQFTAMIKGARRSISIVDPKVTDPAIGTLLEAKAARGVSVSVMSRGNIKGLTPHGKLLIIDGSTAVVGSVSLSALSLDFRREVAITVNDADCVSQLQKWVAPPGSKSRAKKSSGQRRS
jgi:cardiolipin synthase